MNDLLIYALHDAEPIAVPAIRRCASDAVTRSRHEKARAVNRKGFAVRNAGANSMPRLRQREALALGSRHRRLSNSRPSKRQSLSLLIPTNSIGPPMTRWC